jgi:phosphoglycerate kinase
MRADFDVPLGNCGIADTFRLDAMKPTIDFILSKEPQKLTLIGHLGRPRGKKDPKLSLNPIRAYFKKLYSNKLEIPENLRFDAREEANDPSLAKELSKGIDIFVQECFSTCHRDHASITQIPKFVPQSVAGLNLEKEVTNLSKLLSETVARPHVVIIGGSKTETKAPLISEFEKVADEVLIGSKYIRGALLDLPKETLQIYLNKIAEAKTILWNGPVGQYEIEKYALGTRKIAQAIAEAPAFKVVGGSNTIDALKTYNLLDKMDFVSTGGGAMLEFVLGHRLPGLEALKKI